MESSVRYCDVASTTQSRSRTVGRSGGLRRLGLSKLVVIVVPLTSSQAGSRDQGYPESVRTEEERQEQVEPSDPLCHRQNRRRSARMLAASSIELPRRPRRHAVSRLVCRVCVSISVNFRTVGRCDSTRRKNGSWNFGLSARVSLRGALPSHASGCTTISEDFADTPAGINGDRERRQWLRSG